MMKIHDNLMRLIFLNFICFYFIFGELTKVLDLKARVESEVI